MREIKLVLGDVVERQLALEAGALGLTADKFIAQLLSERYLLKTDHTKVTVKEQDIDLLHGQVTNTPILIIMGRALRPTNIGKYNDLHRSLVERTIAGHINGEELHAIRAICVFMQPCSSIKPDRYYMEIVNVYKGQPWPTIVTECGPVPNAEHKVTVSDIKQNF